ncbi:MAG: NAD(P)/FAD-dependent oxidoreductase [bacterium]
MNFKEKNHINIIGAGPAGLTAAIVLAKHGYKAIIYEISRNVGHRMNGDFQGLENWSSDKDINVLLREIGIDVNFLCVPYYGGDLYAPGMAPLEIKSGKPIFYLIKRGSAANSFDKGLKEQALSLGVEIVFNGSLNSAQGKTIIGTGPERPDFIALGITFETESKDQAVVIFNDKIAPKGYSYLITNGGCGTMATVIYEDYKNGKKYFKDMLDFFKNNKNLYVKNDKKFGGYGNFSINDSNSYNGKIYIGESAGFQDFLWGFGLRYAMVSGYLAAKSIISGTDYDFLWKKEIKPMLETSLVNRYLFEKFGNTGYRYLAKRFAKGDPCDFLKYHYNQSFFKNLLLPIAKSKYKSRAKDIKPQS